MNRILFISCLIMLSICLESCSSDKAEKIKLLEDRADDLKSKQDYQSAIVCNSEIILLDSTNADRYDERADNYRKAFWMDTTKRELLTLELKDRNKAIVLNATTERYLSRADCWKEFEKHDHDNVDYNSAIISDYNFAINAAEDKRVPLLRMGQYYFNQLKDSTNAFPFMKRALNLTEDHQGFHSEDYHIYHEFALMYMKCKRFDRAEKLLSHILVNRELNSNIKEVSEDLADDIELIRCRIEIRDYFGAINLIERNIELSPYENMLKGYCLIKLGYKDIGLNLMRSFASSSGKSITGANGIQKPPGQYSKYSLEYFPVSENQAMKFHIIDEYNWPN